MTNPYLTRYATPAEIQRGCVFAQKFESAGKMVRDGFTIAGTPEWRGPRHGVSLDGATDYFTRDLTMRELYVDVDAVTLRVEFSPDFADDDGAAHVFLAADAAGGAAEYSITKDASDQLVGVLGNTTVVTVANGDFTAYWRTGERNLVELAGTSGDSSLRLNGEEVGTSATAWSAALPDTLAFGSTIAGGSLFDGALTEAMMFHVALGLAEHVHRWNAGGPS